MGRCSACRAHTQHFCFVHQVFVCDGCLVAGDSVHGRCVVRTYRNFIEDSSYIWPPICASCGKQLDIDGDNVRRTCLHVEHASCIEGSSPPDHNCSACQTPLLDSASVSQLSLAIKKRLENMPTIARSSAPTIATAYSWDDSDDWKRSPSRNTINLKLEQRQTRSETTSKIVSETDCSDGIGAKGAFQDNSNTEGTPSRVSMAKRPLPDPVPKSSRDLRLDLELLPHDKDSSGPAGKTAKRDAQSGGLIASTSMRKVMKLGNRRLIEIRKQLSTNRRQLLTLIACVACIVLISFLMSGEEELSAVSRPAVEHVSLPHVRVNPAFIQPRKTAKNQEGILANDQ